MHTGLLFQAYMQTFTKRVKHIGLDPTTFNFLLVKKIIIFS